VTDRFRVTYTPSATIHAWLAESAPRERPAGDRRCLAIGDPVFDRRPAAEKDDAPAELAVRGVLAGLSHIVKILQRLPSTRAEVTEVAGYHAPGSRVLVGEEATEQELVRMAEADELRGFRS